MKKHSLLLIFCAFAASVFSQPLTGIKTIGVDYPSIAAAVSALNTNGVGTGGVTFDVPADYTETIAARLNMTATGTAANPVMFRKSGTGANPLVTAYTGTATPASNTPDGMWSFIGSDYITIDGIDLFDPNSTNPETMDFGYGFFKQSNTNGCQYNTIQNCVVTLSYNNNDLGAGILFEGSVCILVTNSTITAAGTNLNVSNISGSNSYNNFFSNTLRNCNYGISFSGSTATASGDHANIVGGSALTGNNIYNFGGAPGAVNPSSGMMIRNEWDMVISYNTINNNIGTGSNHISTLHAIHHINSNNAIFTVRNNNITLTSGSTGSADLLAIDFRIFGAVAYIMENSITCNYPAPNTGNLYAICSSYPFDPGTTDFYVYDNDISITTGLSGGSGVVRVIYGYGFIPGKIKVVGNHINNMTLTAPAISNEVVGIMTFATKNTAQVTVANNTFSNITYTGATGGTGLLNCIKIQGNPLHDSIIGNVFNNLTVGTSGTVNLINNNITSPPNGTKVIQDNVIQTQFTNNKTGTFFAFYDDGNSPTTVSHVVSGNNFSNININNGGLNYGFYSQDYIGGSTPSWSFHDNVISGFTNTGAGSNFGVTILGLGGSAGSANQIYNNTVSDFTCAGNVTGMEFADPVNLDIHHNVINNLVNTASATAAGLWLHNSNGQMNVFKNDIYNIRSNGTSGTVRGILLGNASGVPVANIYNNYIKDLRTPSSGVGFAIAVIYSGPGTGPVNILNNTLFIDAVSSGAGFGSTGIYFENTTPVSIRANNVVNTSTPGTIGRTYALFHNGTDLSNYNTNSDYNNFYPGTGTNRYIFSDGSNNFSSLTQLRIFLATRDQHTFAELPPFTNSATIPYDLHLTSLSPTWCESGGVAVNSPVVITDDKFASPRFGNAGYTGAGVAPDVGAEEWNGIPRDTIPPVISYTPLTNTFSNSARTLTVTISDLWGIPHVGAGLPVLYWKKNSGTFASAQGVWSSGNSFTFTFGAGVTTGDVISYYVCAQDNAWVTNVSCYPSAGSSGLGFNPPVCAVPPTAPSSYTILALTGEMKIGGTGSTPCPTCQFVDITEAFDFLKESTITGPVKLLLTSSYSSTEEDDFPLVLETIEGADQFNPVTLSPDAGTTVTISGSSSGDAIIKCENSSYFILDGSNNGTDTRDMTITNAANDGTSVIYMGSEGTEVITGITVKNTILTGSNPWAPLVLIGDAEFPGNPGNFSNISVLNTDLKNAGSGILASGGSATVNGYGLTISGNDMNSTGAESIKNTGIYIDYTDGITINNNHISNFDKSDDGNDAGIILGSGCINAEITGNDIHSLGYSGTNGFGAHGIEINTGVNSCGVRIINNQFYDISGDGSDYLTDPAGNPCGIYLTGGQTGVEIYFNTIHLFGNTLNQNNALSMGIFNGTGTSASIKNNMIVNSLGLFGSTGTGSTGIYFQEEVPPVTVLDYNNYHLQPSGSGAGYMMLLGSTGYTTFTGVQNSTVYEDHGQNMDPQFNSNTDLHFQNYDLYEKADSTTGITVDYDSTMRWNPPDIGAFEMNVKIWNGLFSTEWTNPLNWTCYGVPNEHNNIMIFPLTLHTCTGNAAGLHCRHIHIFPSATVEIIPAGNLTIHKSLIMIDDANFLNDGTVTIMGNAHLE